MAFLSCAGAADRMQPNGGRPAAVAARCWAGLSRRLIVNVQVPVARSFSSSPFLQLMQRRATGLAIIR